MDQKISIIIPTFNRKKMLSELLKSMDNGRDEIIVVNDKSTDGTLEMLKKDFPKVKIIEAEGKGQLYGKRLGVEKSTGNIIGFCDDDSIVEKGYLDTVRGAFKDGIDIVQTRLIFKNKGETRIDEENRDTGKLKWNLRNNCKWNFGKEGKFIDACAESGIFFRRSVLNKAYFFDENLIGDGYGESVSFMLRSRQYGYKIYFEPSAINWHLGSDQGGSSERFDQAKTYNTNYTTIITGNMVYLNRRFNRKKYPLVVVYFVLAGLFLTLKTRKNCLKYFLAGIKEGKRAWKE